MLSFQHRPSVFLRPPVAKSLILAKTNHGWSNITLSPKQTASFINGWKSQLGTPPSTPKTRDVTLCNSTKQTLFFLIYSRTLLPGSLFRSLFQVLPWWFMVSTTWRERKKQCFVVRSCFFVARELLPSTSKHIKSKHQITLSGGQKRTRTCKLSLDRKSLSQHVVGGGAAGSIRWIFFPLTL